MHSHTQLYDVDKVQADEEAADMVNDEKIYHHHDDAGKVNSEPENTDKAQADDEEINVANDENIDYPNEVNLDSKIADKVQSNDEENYIVSRTFTDLNDHSHSEESDETLNQDSHANKSDRIKDTRSKQEMVQGMFDSFEKSKLGISNCGNDKSVLEESNRFANCVILRRKEPWWTCLDDILSQDKSKEKNNIMSKGRWFCEQSICSNNDVAFSMQAVDSCSGIERNRIWWNVENNFSQDSLSSDLRWYFSAMNKDQQLQDQLVRKELDVLHSFFSVYLF